MSNKRKQYSPQFKARIALEAIKGDKTVPELASQYELHPTLINGWKRQLLDKASEVFQKDSKGQKGKENPEAEVNELYRIIGQLKVERDGHLTVAKTLRHPCPHFLADRSAKLGLTLEKPW